MGCLIYENQESVNQSHYTWANEGSTKLKIRVSNKLLQNGLGRCVCGTSQRDPL